MRIRTDADLVLQAFEHCLDLLEQDALAATRRTDAEHAIVGDGAGDDGVRGIRQWLHAARRSHTVEPRLLF